MNKEFFSVKKIAVLGMLIALNIVLTRFQIHTATMKLGLSFITLIIAGELFGPVEAAIIAFIGDFFGTLFNPQAGAYFPGFAVTAILTGIVFGVILKKKVTVFRAVLAAAIVQFVVGLCINTYFISILIGKGFMMLLPGRIAQTVLMFVLQVVCILSFDKLLIPQLKRMTYAQ